MVECSQYQAVVTTEVGTPFANADEAWLWAVKGMKSRLDGTNIKDGMADTIRPCEASDILICVRSLRREGKISADELRVLLLYGSYSVLPMVLGKKHAAANQYWQRGIEALAPILE